MEPISASVASGLIVAVLGGIATAIIGEGDAQVRCVTQITGPDGDDIAFNDDETDLDWAGLETELDCVMPVVEADNGGDPHQGWADLHYHYKNDAWRPNTDDYANERWKWLFANARPDDDPVAGNNGSPTCPGPNATCVASVAAFCTGGKIRESFKKQDGQVVKAPGGGPRFGSPEVGITGFATLYFTKESFRFTPSGNFVIVEPRFATAGDVDVMHSTASVNTAPSGPTPSAPPTLLSPLLRNLGPLGTSRVEADYAALANNSTSLSYSPSATAELTMAGASLRFQAATLARFDGGGQPRTEFDLLEEYFGNTIAVSVVAPAQAQAGYTPNVTHREVVVGLDPIGAAGIDPDLVPAIQPAILRGMRKDGTTAFLDTETIGILLGGEGTLLDAINLSAQTPGTDLETLVGGLSNGASFDLDMTVSSSGLGYEQMTETVAVTSNVIPFLPTPVLLALAALFGWGVYTHGRRERVAFGR